MPPSPGKEGGGSRLFSLQVGPAAGFHHFVLEVWLSTQASLTDPLCLQSCPVSLDLWFPGHPGHSLPTADIGGSQIRPSTATGTMLLTVLVARGNLGKVTMGLPNRTRGHFYLRTPVVVPKHTERQSSVYMSFTRMKQLQGLNCANLFLCPQCLGHGRAQACVKHGSMHT